MQLSGLRWVWVFRRRVMSWNKTVLSALLTLIILSAPLAGNATAQALHRSRNNETAARTLLGGRGRFQGGDTAASHDYTAGAPAGRSGLRERIALDTAEATTDPADSPARKAVDRRRNHTC